MNDIRQSGFWQDLFKKILTILLKNTGLKSRPATRNQHVVPHPEGWAVRGEGNEKYTAIYDRQAQAIRTAREIAQRYGSDVIIHREDGTIRDRISY